MTFVLSSPGRKALAYELLCGLKPRDVVAFCDMTGTLLWQGAGMPVLLRRLLCEFLRDDGVLVCVTGDSLPVARAEFLDRLPLRARRPVYLITGSGHRFDVACRRGGRWSIRNLARGRELGLGVRKSLLAAACRVLRQSFGLHERAAVVDRDIHARLLSPRGGRVDLAGRFANLGETAWLEIAANKLTLFFPQRPEVNGLAGRLLDALTADKGVATIAAREQLQIIRGGNFVDIIASDKGAAVRRFYELGAGKRLTARHAILLGDSWNDLPMFEADLPAAATTRVFLGADPALARRIEAAPGRSVQLTGQYVAGAEFVFDLITDGAHSLRRLARRREDLPGRTA